jgi:putative heme-binding domain-containing protein
VGLKDGRVLTGLLAEDSPSHITLVDTRAERMTIARGEIESIADSPASLMPENLYRELSPQDLRDLFAYLQAP